jgi:hypothetical protein
MPTFEGVPSDVEGFMDALWELQSLLQIVTSTMEDVLALVAWVQQRHHQADRSHRQRRKMGLNTGFCMHYTPEIISVVHQRGQHAMLTLCSGR